MIKDITIKTKINDQPTQMSLYVANELS